MVCMKIFALSDMHLSFSGAKPMSVFGPHWLDHAAKMERSIRQAVGGDDVLCMAGDFSWATKLDEARAELEWLGSLPGNKILLKGNHDYWWASASKVRKALPEGVYAISGDSLRIGDAVFGGARGWADPSLDFDALFPELKKEDEGFYTLLGEEEDKKLYDKEVARLEASLSSMGDAKARIALLHFPPTDPSLKERPVTALLEKHKIDHALFGHLHLSGPTVFKNPFGTKNGVTYHLTSADFIDFAPALIAEL